jgi:hypothetical protein
VNNNRSVIRSKDGTVFANRILKAEVIDCGSTEGTLNIRYGALQAVQLGRRGCPARLNHYDLAEVFQFLGDPRPLVLLRTQHFGRESLVNVRLQSLCGWHAVLDGQYSRYQSAHRRIVQPIEEAEPDPVRGSAIVNHS